MREPRPTFFTPDNKDSQRRLGAGEATIAGANQMIIRGLSGEFYQNLDLAIQPGSNTVIIGDNVRARQELITDLSHANEMNDGQTVQLPRGSRIEFVKPAITTVDDPSVSLRDFFLQSRGIAGVEARLTELWANSASDPEILREAGRLQEIFEEAGGWDADREMEQLLRGLRLVSNEHDTINLNTRLGEMSSGQISKAIIGKALFSRAGIIIMDDPSVHLDVYSKQWLAEYIRSSNQATIIATSDMDFATEIGDRVVEILDSKLTLNIGTNVENYYTERQKLINFWLDEAERRKQEIEELKIHIRDFLAPAARKTDNMAQVLRATESRLDRMVVEYNAMPGKILIESRKQAPKQRVFQEGERSGQDVFRINNLSIMYESEGGFGEPTIVHVPNLEVDRGNRLAVVGSNGSGKSTLLRVLAGQTEGMLTEGSFKPGASVRLGYYSPYTELPDPDIPLRQILGRYTRDPMGILSYWGFDRSEYYETKPSQLRYRDEVTRAQFAMLMAMSPNVLLLDEPTSYLTPSYREKLLAAINGYDGTLLLVSHDPVFLSKAKLKGKIAMPGAERIDL